MCLMSRLYEYCFYLLMQSIRDIENVVYLSPLPFSVFSMFLWHNVNDRPAGCTSLPFLPVFKNASQFVFARFDLSCSVTKKQMI